MQVNSRAPQPIYELSSKMLSLFFIFFYLFNPTQVTLKILNTWGYAGSNTTRNLIAWSWATWRQLFPYQTIFLLTIVHC